MRGRTQAGNRCYDVRRKGEGPVKSFSVVIINDDAEEYLAGLFESINKQEAPEQAEIIFIDNASSDTSIHAARNYGIIKIYRFEKKEPVPRLYNKGLELSESPAVLFLHSDVVLREGFFRACNEAIPDLDGVPLFINFNQYYVDHNRFGCNFIGCTIQDRVFFYRKYFDWNYTGTIELVQCSEGCFMINFGSMKGKPYFDERYHGSLFEYAYLVENNLYPACGNGAYYHYFIEAHEKLSVFEEDRALFIARCWPLLNALLRKKLRRAKIIIAIRALINILLPKGSLRREAVVKTLSTLRIKL
jgi:glycosyltransferase involved in cell wall biosynthesis